MDWGAFFSTFGLIFVAELGDKTQLAVITQTCKYRQPWAVFLGATLALTGVTALGAIGGQVLGQLIPAHVLRLLAGLAFVVMGLFIAREAAKTPATSSVGASCALDENAVCGLTTSKWNWQAFTATLGLLFVAELGDKTQLAVLGLASESRAPWLVFIGGAVALSAVTGLGVIGGQGLCRVIPQRLLLWISAAAFVILGVLMAVGIL